MYKVAAQKGKLSSTRMFDALCDIHNDDDDDKCWCNSFVCHSINVVELLKGWSQVLQEEEQHSQEFDNQVFHNVKKRDINQLLQLWLTIQASDDKNRTFLPNNIMPMLLQPC